MPRCLVTGATGFIGPHLAATLQAAGGEVACLVRPTSDTRRLEALGVRLVPGDVCQPESLLPALTGVDVVIHLAGRTIAPSYEQFAEVNERGVALLAAACASLPNPPVLVVVSSLAAAGPSSPGERLTEEDPCEPVSHYGRSKLAGEHAAREWAAEVPISIVRPPAVFGPADRLGFYLVRSIANSGLHFVHRPGLPLSLVHVSDLCRAILLVARHGERLNPTNPGGEGVYYVADPEVSSHEAVGRMIGEGLGRRVRVVKVRRWALTTAAAVGELSSRWRGKPGIVNFDKIREATASGWTVAPNKIATQFDFRPAMSLADGYRETVAWYRAEKWLGY